MKEGSFGFACLLSFFNGKLTYSIVKAFSELILQVTSPEIYSCLKINNSLAIPGTLAPDWDIVVTLCLRLNNYQIICLSFWSPALLDCPDNSI